MRVRARRYRLSLGGQGWPEVGASKPPGLNLVLRIHRLLGQALGLVTFEPLVLSLDQSGLCRKQANSGRQGRQWPNRGADFTPLLSLSLPKSLSDLSLESHQVARGGGGPRGDKVTCWRMGKEFALEVEAGAEVAIGGRGQVPRPPGAGSCGSHGCPRGRWAQASLSPVRGRCKVKCHRGAAGRGQGGGAGLRPSPGEPRVSGRWSYWEGAGRPPKGRTNPRFWDLLQTSLSPTGPQTAT